MTGKGGGRGEGEGAKSYDGEKAWSSIIIKYSLTGTRGQTAIMEQSELEFLKSQWGLGTEEEEGYRTGPSGYIG